MNELDFKGLADYLLQRAEQLLAEWLPGGRMRGREYTCGNLSGGDGTSLSVNVGSGLWADFAADEKGGDLISLYARIHGIKNGEAAKQLSEKYNFDLKAQSAPIPRAPKSPEKTIIRPPQTGIRPKSFNSTKFGKPTRIWTYSDAEGVLFYIARYDPSNTDGKQFLPWSWDGEKWVNKAWPAPRPLYGLPDLIKNPQKPVLLVEGEKCAESARNMTAGVYSVITWPGGAQAIESIDWTPIHGRRVLIWPDNDAAGIMAAQKIAAKLHPHCEGIKILDVSERAPKWDAAEAEKEGFTWDLFARWAKPRAKKFAPEELAVSATAIAAPNSVAVAKTEVTIRVEDEQNDATSTHVALWEKIGIALTGTGVPVCNVDNALRIFERYEHCKDLFWYDEFHRKFFTGKDLDNAREWKEVDTLKLLVYIQRNLGIRKMSDTMVRQAVLVRGHQNVRNEPRDWMETLKWDGVRRIDQFFHGCFGAVDTKYVSAASKNFWISMAARVYKPGCQVDNMVILESFQGMGKTRALRLIGGKWYTEIKESATNKDFFMCLNGKLIAEIAELDAFSRAEVTKIKQVVTCPTDNYRAPYERTPEDHPRTSIFVGTTNEKNYLRDNTGARRFWPIEVKAVEYDLIAKFREQLFAEAAARFKSGEDWWKMPDAETADEQERRRQLDPWDEIIEDYSIGKFELTIQEIATQCLKIEISRLDRLVQMRISTILRNLGWERRTLRRDGKQSRFWVKTEASEEEESRERSLKQMELLDPDPDSSPY